MKKDNGLTQAQIDQQAAFAAFYREMTSEKPHTLAKTGKDGIVNFYDLPVKLRAVVSGVGVSDKQASVVEKAFFAQQQEIKRLQNIIDQTGRMLSTLESMMEYEESGPAQVSRQIISMIDRGELDEAQVAVDAAYDMLHDGDDLMNFDASVPFGEGMIVRATRPISQKEHGNQFIGDLIEGAMGIVSSVLQAEQVNVLWVNSRDAILGGLVYPGWIERVDEDELAEEAKAKLVSILKEAKEINGNFSDEDEGENDDPNAEAEDDYTFGYAADDLEDDDGDFDYDPVDHYDI